MKRSARAQRIMEEMTMDRFLISVPHSSDTPACTDVVHTFLQTGSHYLTHADWGCEDGDHTAWMIVEGETREEVAQIVPPPFRAQSRVVRLTKFTLDEVEEIQRSHKAQTGD